MKAEGPHQDWGFDPGLGAALFLCLLPVCFPIVRRSSFTEGVAVQEFWLAFFGALMLLAVAYLGLRHALATVCPT